MYGYTVVLKEKIPLTQLLEKEYYLKTITEIPPDEQPEVILDLIQASGSQINKNHCQFVSIRQAGPEAERMYENMTCIIPCHGYRILAVPDSASKVQFQAGYRSMLLLLPSNVVNADCTGDFARIHIARATADVAHSIVSKVNWEDFVQALKSHPDYMGAKYGIQVYENDIMLNLWDKCTCNTILREK